MSNSASAVQMIGLLRHNHPTVHHLKKPFKNRGHTHEEDINPYK
jgi:hypothetical protein